MSELEEEKETSRVEAFSDGVIAIAITLLVLELKVPHGAADPGGLLKALLHQWPSYVAFVMSFGTILIMWINHHRLFTLIRKTDNWLVLLNGFLLLFITIVPFPTSLLAEYFRTPSERMVTLLYVANGFNIAVAFQLLWRHATRGGHLLSRRVDMVKVEAVTQRYRFGPLFYLAAFGVAFISPTASVLVCGALAVFFARMPPDPLNRSSK